MAFIYRIYKQLIPVPMNESDPSWAKRQVWVAKLNSIDTVEEFADLTAAQSKKTELVTADETGRVYKISKVLAEEVGTRPQATTDEEGNSVPPTVEDTQAYMTANEIPFTESQTVEELLEVINSYWATPAEDIE